VSTRIILDCDPGHDDAMAIVLAHGAAEVELAAITTVAGNHGLELTTLNALRICSLCGIDGVPIAAGCAAPLIRPLVTAPQIHGETGLEGHVWAEPTLSPVPDHAVDLIIDLVMAAPGEITLVPTGPVTNIAMALRKEPRIASRVREVVLMGGAWSRGNQTPAAEFNTYVDPEAAAIVFGGAWPVTMIGLEVTEMAVATEDVFERIDAVATPVAEAVSGMLRFYQAQQLREVGTVAPPVHDPCAVARAARPELVECRDAYIEVELAGRLTTGMTVTDFRAVEGRPFNAKAGISLAVAGFWDLFIDALARIATPGPPVRR
jgi:purine nucleosidase